ncbi:hypothetical protein X802_04590 [Thermococcus guaymasensis DSM 11113]|uniref:Uncharacterized protein n=1 Tax=Thermococcus guaymasensis DSM 11113 TaxID=1432656 RepID=A0A0X1KJU4_9EURY|nr:hypothetical protein [Thermococcus guaymasensis]AJC71526.1 hypothetical protein X802_04590 [Thermococcus guaymasensis DSM 11113]
MLDQFKLLPSVAYLRVERQAFIGYSMPLAGWIGEYLINYQKLPRPNFLGRAMRKLGFSLVGEERDDRYITQFFTKKGVSISASWDVERENLFLQLVPLRSRLSRGLTVRAENIEFYDQYVVSIEPAGKLPPGVRGIGIRALILEDFYPIEIPYWGMLHEDWESELNLLVMMDEVYDSLRREEYRCPVCFSPLSEENGVLKCPKCGFVYAPENDFERVLDEFRVEEFAF